MNKKLIFLDIDGTLTPPGSNCPPESAVKAIQAARKNGHKVFLCTGRNPGMLAPLLKYGFDGVVASAGGYLEYEGKVIYDHPMTDRQRDLALETLHSTGVFCTIEARDRAYGDEDLGTFLSESQGGNSEIQRWRAALAGDLGIRPMKEYQGEPVYKVVFMCREESQLEPARKALEEEFNFCCQNVKNPPCINGELIHRDFDKGKGVQRICEYLGWDIRDTIGFGDSMNDLEMIQVVGCGVAMDNGNQRLKELAHRTAPSVEEDGLAQAFQWLELI